MNSTTHPIADPLEVALSLIAEAGLGPLEVCGGTSPDCDACHRTSTAHSGARGPQPVRRAA